MRTFQSFCLLNQFSTSLSLGSAPGLPPTMMTYLPVAGSSSTCPPPPASTARTTRASSRSRKRLRVRGGRGVVCLRLDICPESAHLERRMSSRQISTNVDLLSLASYCTALLSSTMQRRRRAQALHKIFLLRSSLAFLEQRPERDE